MSVTVHELAIRNKNHLMTYFLLLMYRNRMIASAAIMTSRHIGTTTATTPVSTQSLKSTLSAINVH